MSGPAVNLITIPIVTRALGVDSFGVASIAISAYAYVSIVATMGLAIYGTRELARLRDNKYEFEKVFSELLLASFFSSLLATFFLYSAFLFFFEISTAYLYIICAGVFLNFLNIEWLYYSLEKFRVVAVINLLSKLAGFLFVYFFVDSVDKGPHYVASVVISNAIGFIIISIIGIHSVKITFNDLDVVKHLKSLLNFTLIRLFSSINSVLDIVIVGYFTTVAQAGVYALASRVIRIGTTVVSAMTAVTMPKASSLISNSKYNDYYDLSTSVIFFSLLLSFLGVFSIFFWSDEIVEVLGGSGFYSASGLMASFVFLIPIVALSNFTGMQILYPRKKDKHVTVSIIAGGLVCILVMPVFTIRYGLHGAVIAVLLAEATVLLYQSIAAREVIYNLFLFSGRKIIGFMFLILLYFPLMYWVWVFLEADKLAIKFVYYFFSVVFLAILIYFCFKREVNKIFN